jgi:DNA-binding GntR family transcriptional regulator
MVDQRDATYRQIREKLLDGSIRSPRDLSRRRLAAALDATPTHTQWALNRMEAEGLLESRPQSGTFVRKLSHEEFQELYDVRRLIEPYAAGRAARFIRSDELAQLEQACDEMGKLPEIFERTPGEAIPPEYDERLVQLEIAFHGAILQAARNAEAARIVENIQILTHLIQRNPARRRETSIATLQRTVAEHRAIAAAIRSADSKLARRLMRRHISLNRLRHAQSVLKDLNRQESP